jgi:hypothetical protein
MKKTEKHGFLHAQYKGTDTEKVLQELHEARSVCAEFPFALPYDLDFISIFSALFCS